MRGSVVPPLLLKFRAAAEALSISERMLFGLTQPRGPIPALRLPGRGNARAIRYDVRDLLAFIDGLKQAASGTEGLGEEGKGNA